MMRALRVMAGIALALCGVAASAAPAAYDPAPWLADLAQVRAALNTNYANLDWLMARGPIDVRFDRATQRIQAADSDAGARRAIERLLERFHDGHVEISWPVPTGPAAAPGVKSAAPPTALTFCNSMGYGRMQPSNGSVAKLPGYTPLATGPAPAGTMRQGDTIIGAITLGIFQPEAFPDVCISNVAALKLSLDKPCDDACSNRVTTRVYADLTRMIAARIAALRGAGATVLLLDLSGNGGGSEWAEAVARMLTPKPLVPAPWGIVRTPAWTKRWAETATSLESASRTARGQERLILLREAAKARAFAAETSRMCNGEACPRLATGGYATGMLATPPAVFIKDETASAALWSPAQFAAPVGAWQGPLIILVDGETWSAAEEVAATLQDNKAAAILGERTGGAGCGHASDADPITLRNSGGELTLPDCARFRRDGSNEVSGIVPDILTGHRADDNDALKAKLIAAKLGDAIAFARTLQP